jgi:curved DNA-binding protein CbpA
MVDYFAVLDEPRRPWLNPDELRSKFLILSAQVHPDRVHGADDATRQAAQTSYAELNAAFNCLREPKDRLRHLLELELGVKPKDVQGVPPDLMTLLMEVSRLCREVDAFLVEKAKVTSPLLQVQVFARGQEWTEGLMALQKRINSWREQLEAELKEIDASWRDNVKPDSPARLATLRRVEELYRLFSYFAKSSAQLQERIAQISF